MYVLTNSEAFGAVESVKAASDVYLPASGKIIATNEVRSLGCATRRLADGLWIGCRI